MCRLEVRWVEGPWRVVVTGVSRVVVVLVLTVCFRAPGPRRRVISEGLDSRVVVVAGRRRWNILIDCLVV